MWRIVRRMQRPAWGRGPRYSRLGLTGRLAIAAVALILIAAWFIDRRGASDADQDLAELASAAGVEPVQLMARAARAHRVVFISDIAGSAAVKHFTAEVVAEMAETSGLDAVVLEVGADLQPWIDRYLDRQPENAAVLLAQPRLTGGGGAAGRAYLDLYRTIWRLNQSLGADQRIRIVAADLPGWPPAAAQSPSTAARRMAERAEYMEQEVEALLGAIPRARILIFVTGLHALRAGTVNLKTGGTAPVQITPLAARLPVSPQEVFTALVDAPAGPAPAHVVAPYTGTRVASVLERAGVRRRIALPVSAAFDHLRQPVLERAPPGIEIDIQPRDYDLRTVADAYINLGR